MMNKNNVCPLYGAVHGALITFDTGACTYALVASILFQLCYCLYRFITMVLLHFRKISENHIIFAPGIQRLYILHEVIVTILTFVSACILSAGINSSCSNITCSLQNWYSAGQTAQAGAWISTFIFVALTTFGVLYLRGVNSEAPTQGVSFTASSGYPGTVISGIDSSQQGDTATHPNQDNPHPSQGSSKDYPMNENPQLYYPQNPPRYEDILKTY
ncbi:uncharacterized protein LOC131941804 isoform X5 [Physella acuta]|nr:uncharacterized protein LOC131941804 isoform X2 [Physella acuta]XP_059157314.1 uncharacterized protein LOC131941804 isoform X3 [Physella acuta]XP_059157315.1 uncharacterized protein LOC131941804 isoform X4 [Physella acuta]XP_059157316.1 uncharacterized protein LOC131941804 isoform X5 [Physella acuta]